MKTKFTKIENKPLRANLIELIKREFKTLGSDDSHYSYALKAFFSYLKGEK